MLWSGSARFGINALAANGPSSPSSGEATSGGQIMDGITHDALSETAGLLPLLR